METNVLEFGRANRMSDAEFDAAYARFEQTYGDNNVDTKIKRDKELASLLHESGKTTRWLANRLGKEHDWIVNHVRFGHFLENCHLVSVDTKYLSIAESAFRILWRQTLKSGDRNHRKISEIREQERFAQVVELIKAAQSNQRSPQQKAADKKLAERILDRFADGRWHKPETIAKTLDVDTGDLSHALNTIAKSKIEMRGGGGKEEYRILEQDRKLSALSLRKELGPMINRLVHVLKQAAEHPVHDNPRVMLVEAQTLKTLFDRITR
jgi:hypothetical protein